jgi:hypothetical protein
MRDSFLQLTDLDLVKRVYESMVLFDKLGYDKENQVRYKMKDGELQKLYLELQNYIDALDAA